MHLTIAGTKHCEVFFHFYLIWSTNLAGKSLGLGLWNFSNVLIKSEALALFIRQFNKQKGYINYL